MGDHFVSLVDRLLTESTLEAAIRSRNRLQQISDSDIDDTTTNFTSNRMDINVGSPPRRPVQCRICHDEDEESNMEVPCSCCGSLKYAHRRCVQTWCNEKGDTICEICHQQFKPDYTAPPPVFHYSGIPVNFRGNWEISTRDLNNHQFIAMVSPGHNFLDHNFDDYSVLSPRRLICCRVVAIIFVVLLVLRHALPILVYGGAGDYSFTSFMLLMLSTVAIVLPIYIAVKVITIIQRSRHQQNPSTLPLATSNEDSELPTRPPFVITVR